MKRLLFIAHRLPYPPDKGERVRAFNEIKALAGEFRVTLGCLVHGGADRRFTEGLEPFCDRIIVARAGGRLGLVRGALGVGRGKSVTEGYFSSRKLRKSLLAQARPQPFDIAVGYSSSTLGYLLAVPAERRVMDLVDVDSAKWSAYAASARPPARWAFGREARLIRRLEQRALDACDAVILVSRAECAALAPAHPKLHAIGCGVDGEYFAPAGAPADSQPSVVFTGTMDYRPNVEAVCWFADRVWPQLKRRLRQLRFTIVGRDPSRQVLRLGRTPGITVTGAVADVRPYLAAATVALCPLHIARGVQNKVLEAMACGLPVVGSPEALSGLDVQVGRDVLEADSADQWRKVVLDLLTDPALRERIGRAARKRVLQTYSWAAQLAPLVSLCGKLADEGAPKLAGALDD